MGLFRLLQHLPPSHLHDDHAFQRIPKRRDVVASQAPYQAERDLLETRQRSSDPQGQPSKNLKQNLAVRSQNAPKSNKRPLRRRKT